MSENHNENKKHPKERIHIPSAEYFLDCVHFSYDPKNHQWLKGIYPVDRSEPLEYLIHIARNWGIRWAGSYAERNIERIETDPRNTIKEFKKIHLEREYGNRIPGIILFKKWLEWSKLEVDSDEIEDISLYMQKHSDLVHRFYDSIESMGIRIKKQARVWGEGIKNHVIIGYRIIHRRINKKRSVSRETLTTTAELDINDTDQLHSDIISKLTS